QRLDQRAAAVVTVERPDHGPGDALRLDVGRLRPQDGRVVEGPERAAVEEPGVDRRGVAGQRVPLGGQRLEFLAVLVPGLEGGWRGTRGGLEQPAVGVAYAGPAPPVERDAKDQLGLGRAPRGPRVDGGVGAELRSYRLARGRTDRRLVV